MRLLAEGVAQTGGVRWVQDHLVSAELHRVRSRAGAVVAAEPGGVACEGQIVLAAEISVGYDFARRVLATDWGKQLYLKRQGTVEPVFGQIKSNRGADRFQRRGRSAVRSEWRLLTATHNLLKLHQHQLAAA
jgi:hypothetical protein